MREALQSHRQPESSKSSGSSGKRTTHPVQKRARAQARPAQTRPFHPNQLLQDPPLHAQHPLQLRNRLPIQRVVAILAGDEALDAGHGRGVDEVRLRGETGIADAADDGVLAGEGGDERRRGVVGGFHEDGGWEVGMLSGRGAREYGDGEVGGEEGRHHGTADRAGCLVGGLVGVYEVR